jgi:hypothetical protein
MKKHCSFSALLLLVSLFTQSCQNGGESIGSTTTSGSDTTNANIETEIDYLKTLEKKDFGGVDFVIYAHEAEAFPNLGSGVLNGDVLNDALFNREKNIGEIYNINIVDKGISDRGQLKNDVQKSVLAGEEAYQLIMTSMADGINTLMPNGILYDLNSLPYLDLSNKWWNQNLNKNLNFSGHVYAATGAISRVYYNTPIVTVFNQRLVTDYGFGDLYSIVEDGAWTIDKFAEFMKVGTEDLNNDGNLTDSDKFALLLDEEDGKALFVAAGGRLTEIANDGSYYLDLASERNLTILDKILNIFGDRTKSYAVSSLDINTEKMFRESRATFCIISMGNVISHFRDMKDDYGIIPMPKINETQQEYITYGNPWFAAGVAVPATCSTPEMTGLIMEALAYISYRDVVPAIYDITLREKLTRDEKSKTMLDLIYRDIYFDLNSIYNFGDSANSLRRAAVGLASEAFPTTYARIKPTAENALKEIIEAQAKISN